MRCPDSISTAAGLRIGHKGKDGRSSQSPGYLSISERENLGSPFSAPPSVVSRSCGPLSSSSLCLSLCCRHLSPGPLGHGCPTPQGICEGLPDVVPLPLPGPSPASTHIPPSGAGPGSLFQQNPPQLRPPSRQVSSVLAPTLRCFSSPWLPLLLNRDLFPVYERDPSSSQHPSSSLGLAQSRGPEHV